MSRRLRPEILKRYREQNGFSQVEFGKRLPTPVFQSHVAKWEKNGFEAKILDIAELLNIDPYDLTGSPRKTPVNQAFRVESLRCQWHQTQVCEKTPTQTAVLKGDKINLCPEHLKEYKKKALSK